MLKARRNATTPIGNCEDNWLVRGAVVVALTFRLVALSFPRLAANERLLGDPSSI